MPIRLHDKSPLAATLKPREVTALPAAQTPQSATTDSARFSRHPDLTSGCNNFRNRCFDSGLLSIRPPHCAALHRFLFFPRPCPFPFPSYVHPSYLPSLLRFFFPFFSFSYFI